MNCKIEYKREYLCIASNTHMRWWKIKKLCRILGVANIRTLAWIDTPLPHPSSLFFMHMYLCMYCVKQKKKQEKATKTILFYQKPMLVIRQHVWIQMKRNNTKRNEWFGDIQVWFQYSVEIIKIAGSLLFFPVLFANINHHHHQRQNERTNVQNEKGEPNI